MKVRDFKNYVEDPEYSIIITKNDHNESYLTSKYFNICFYDNEFKETRRIVGVEWYVSMERGISSGYKVVTEILTPYNSEEKKQNNESNYETYCINEILFEMVLECSPSSQ